MSKIRAAINKAVAAVVSLAERTSARVAAFLHRPGMGRAVATGMVAEGIIRTIVLSVAGIYVLTTATGPLAVVTGVTLLVGPWAEAVLRFSAADELYRSAHSAV